MASYASVVVGERVAEGAAWSFPSPARGFEAIAGAWAFYAHLLDECRVDGELVDAQAGGF